MTPNKTSIIALAVVASLAMVGFAGNAMLASNDPAAELSAEAGELEGTLTTTEQEVHIEESVAGIDILVDAKVHVDESVDAIVALDGAEAELLAKTEMLEEQLMTLDASIHGDASTEELTAELEARIAEAKAELGSIVDLRAELESTQASLEGDIAMLEGKLGSAQGTLDVVPVDLSVVQVEALVGDLSATLTACVTGLEQFALLEVTIDETIAKIDDTLLMVEAHIDVPSVDDLEATVGAEEKTEKAEGTFKSIFTFIISIFVKAESDDGNGEAHAEATADENGAEAHYEAEAHAEVENGGPEAEAHAEVEDTVTEVTTEVEGSVEDLRDCLCEASG